MAIEWLEKMGFKNPESKLTNGTMVPPETLDILLQHLTEMGVDPAMAQQVVQGSLHEALDARDAQAQQADHGQAGRAWGGAGRPRARRGRASRQGEQGAQQQQAA
jgi:hypothetical protein